MRNNFARRIMEKRMNEVVVSTTEDGQIILQNLIVDRP